MIHGFTAAYTTMRVNMIVNAFRQIGEEFCFPFAKWETVSPMAQLAIGSASLADNSWVIICLIAINDRWRHITVSINCTVDNNAI